MGAVKTTGLGAVLGVFGALALPPAALDAAELTGRVELVSKGRTLPGRVGEAVVYYEPDRPRTPVRPRDEPAEMATRDKQFRPRVLVVTTGSTVAFPNRDPILHNVFSVSDPYRFDLGLYGEGERESVPFDRPGVVRVFCNVHHGMVGYVLALETPHHTRPDEGGGFRLTGLPEGSGELTVWHEQAEPWTRRVRIPSGPVAVRLELTKPKIPPHRNKFGRSYRRFGRGRYDGH